MKTLKRLLSLFLLTLLCAGMLALPAGATTTYEEHDGLEITVKMDKEQYEDGEPITATITVTNTNLGTVTISNLEQLIPEGYKLSEDSKASMQNIELRPERTIILEVTFEKETTEAEAAAEDFFAKFLEGTFWGIPNVLVAVILVIAFVVFMILT